MEGKKLEFRRPESGDPKYKEREAPQEGTEAKVLPLEAGRQRRVEHGRESTISARQLEMQPVPDTQKSQEQDGSLEELIIAEEQGKLRKVIAEIMKIQGRILSLQKRWGLDAPAHLTKLNEELKHYRDMEKDILEMLSHMEKIRDEDNSQ